MFFEKRDQFATHFLFFRAGNADAHFGAGMKPETDQGHNGAGIACSGIGDNFNIAGIIHDFFRDDGRWTAVDAVRVSYSCLHFDHGEEKLSHGPIMSKCLESNGQQAEHSLHSLEGT